MNALSQPRKMGAVLLADGGRQDCCSRCGTIPCAGAGPRVFPSPREVEKGMAELLRHHVLCGGHRRFAAPRGRSDSALAVLIGVPLGLTLGWYPGGESGRESGDADPAAHQPDRVDSGGDHLLWGGRWRCCIPDFSRRIFPDRGGLHQRRGERAFGVSPRGAQFRADSAATSGGGAVPGGASPDPGGAAHRARALRGWWWWRQK